MRRLHTLALVVIAPTLLTVAIIANGADKLAPRVRITRPADGATVSASIYVDVAYQSLSGQPIVRVDLFIDAVRVSNYALINPRTRGVQSFLWDTKQVAASQFHTVQAQAYDALGHNGAAKIRVFVRNEAPAPGPTPGTPPQRDIIPPAVQVTYPTNGAVVSDRIEIGVTATDDNGMDYVVFYLDDKFLALTNQAPYRFALDTKRLTDGLHTTHSAGFDTSDNKGESAKVYFTVNNYSATGTAPPPPISATATPAVIGEGTTAKRETIVAPPAPAAPRKTQVARAPEPTRLTSTPPATDRSRIQLEVKPHSQLSAAILPGGRRALVSQARSTTPSLAALAALPQPVAASPSTSRALRALDAAVAATHLVADVERPIGPPLATTPAGTVAPVAEAAAEPQGARARQSRQPSPAEALALEGPSRELGATRSTAPGEPVLMAALPDGLRASPDPTLADAVKRLPTLKAIVRGAGQRATMPPRVVEDLLPDEAVATRGEMYAMLPRAFDMGAAPERSTVVTTPSGQRISEPAIAALEDLTHVAHIGGKDYRIVFDGDLLKLRTPPMVKASISTGPFREIFEHTGGVVNWYPVGKRVEAKNDSTKVELQIGKPEARVNDDTRTLELAPFIVNGRTMIPLTFIRDALDVTVEFNPKTGAILITSNEF